jgi:hypothetical protein
MDEQVGTLRKVIGVKHQAQCLCGEGAYVTSPRPVHAMRLQRDAVLGFTIGSPQVAMSSVSIERPRTLLHTTGQDVFSNGVPWRMVGYPPTHTPTEPE